jgi:hypothetical protein
MDEDGLRPQLESPEHLTAALLSLLSHHAAGASVGSLLPVALRAALLPTAPAAAKRLCHQLLRTCHLTPREWCVRPVPPAAAHLPPHATRVVRAPCATSCCAPATSRHASGACAAHTGWRRSDALRRRWKTNPNALNELASARGATACTGGTRTRASYTPHSASPSGMLDSPCFEMLP